MAGKESEAKDRKYVETPLMKQYYSIKAVHGDAVLLFRVGDFYETFGEDAVRASRILGITLTRRANGAASYVELAGFPYHALDTYLPKLVRAGERVAVCEQLEDPKLVKGIVKRGVIELVTPGVVLSDNVLVNKENTFLASVHFGKKTTGVAFLDLSTGEFYVAEGRDDYVDKLLSNLAPKEIIYQRGWEERFTRAFGTRNYTYKLDEWVFAEDINREKLCKQFGTASLKGYGIDSMTSGISAAGAILYYLDFTEHKNVGHITGISRIDENAYVWIDRFTIRNLELFSSNSLRERCGFADVIDRTVTPMGGRLLKQWIALPIKDVARLNRRLDVVERFRGDDGLREEVGGILERITDLERLSSRIATQRITPREMVQLKLSLGAVADLRRVLGRCGAGFAGRGARFVRGAAGAYRKGAVSRPAEQSDTEGGHHCRWRGPRTGRPAPHRMPRQGRDCRDTAARERGDRYPVAQGELQQRLRLLYRGEEHPQGQGAGRLDTQADADFGRTLHYAGAQGV